MMPGEFPAGDAPGQYVPVAARPTNAMAIASLVCAFVFFPLGIVFGYIAKKQIAQTGEEGEGLAKVSIIIGWAHLALAGVVIMLMISLAILSHSR